MVITSFFPDCVKKNSFRFSTGFGSGLMRLQDTPPPLFPQYLGVTAGYTLDAFKNKVKSGQEKLPARKPNLLAVIRGVKILIGIFPSLEVGFPLLHSELIAILKIRPILWEMVLPIY